MRSQGSPNYPATETLKAPRPNEWLPIQYNDEDCLVSLSSDESWIAIVSIDRGRLIHLGPAIPNGRNLIRLSRHKCSAHDCETDSWGGHIAWLYRNPGDNWIWPPPLEWEYEAPESVVTKGQALHLEMKHFDQRYPRLSRSYKWTEANELSFTLSWPGIVEASILGITTLHLPEEAIIYLNRIKTAELPSGYVEIEHGFLAKKPTEKKLPPSLRQTTKGIVPKITDTPAKFGFKAQDITAIIGDYCLSMIRGKCDGEPAGEPFGSCLTHLWIGYHAQKERFIEIEQLSPLLRSANHSHCSFTVRFKIENFNANRSDKPTRH